MFTNKFFKKIYEKAREINEKNKIRILFPDYHFDRNIRAAIKIIKQDDLCIPVYFDKKYPLEKLLGLCKFVLTKNYVDGVVLGSSFSSVHSLRLSFNFMEKGIERISGSMLMFNKNKAYLFADVAAIPYPSSHQLVEIAYLTTKTFKLLIGKKPVIAFLSYSSFGSGRGEEPERIRKAVVLAREIFKKKKIKAIIDGEIQADAALVKWIAIKKAKEYGHKPLIKGNANIFIFPNLSSANISYKLLERLGNWNALGPILQGTSKVINDLSRGCDVDDIVGLAAISTIMVWDKMKNKFKES
jgi:phosphate acetyltransferase